MNGLKLLNTPEAARALGVSSKTLLLYANTGRLQAQKIGRAWKFTEDAIDRFMRGEQPEPKRRGAPTVGDALAVFVPGLADELRALRVILYRGGPVKPGREKLDAIMHDYIRPMEAILSGTEEKPGA